ncbi:MAG TPA: hypothetical protein VFR23_25570 [Jiangellaceae bacterium]|nr:hypothetical protein [Jiangellaceae bacterium]
MTYPPTGPPQPGGPQPPTPHPVPPPREVADVLRVAREALAEMPRECRFHGGYFGHLGFQWGEPRCESCRQPWRVDTALRRIDHLLDRVTVDV